MIFCSISRFKKLNAPAKNYYYDTSMRNTVYMPGNIDTPSIRGNCFATTYDVNNLAAGGRTQAMTTDSDGKDTVSYRAAPEPKKLQDFKIERPNIAYAVDFCTWFLHYQLMQGWPSINKARITQTQQPGFKGGITDYSMPVDGLRGVGLSMLHEVRCCVTL
jgi:hypothetical protein